MSELKFTVDDAQAAYDEWRFNCGPGALCAMLDLTPSELRPHCTEFEKKGYSSPKIMYSMLRSLRVEWETVFYSPRDPQKEIVWPRRGLVRVQWGGPWTKPGVPMKARYRQTHWIGCISEGRPIKQPYIFDINTVSVGGWVTLSEWDRRVVPWLLEECVPRADGEWWPTHCLELL